MVLDGSDDIDTSLEDPSSFLDNVENERKVLAGKLQAVVENGLEQARDLMGRSPEKAIQELKLLLEQVDSATDVAGDIRQQLRKQIEDAIRETGARQVDVDEQKMLAQSREANAQRLKNLADETARKQELITSLMEKFNVLMDEAALEDDRKRVDEGEKYLTADAEIAMPIQVYYRTTERQPRPFGKLVSFANTKVWRNSGTCDTKILPTSCMKTTRH